MMIDAGHSRNDNLPRGATAAAGLDWRRIAASLDGDAYAVMTDVLSRQECDSLVKIYDANEHFRSRIEMSRHGFGSGEYKYFSYPLPEIVAGLRAALYPALSEIANRWNEVLGIEGRYPADHAAYVDRCHRAGQTKPTPLILRYGAGDYNRLHQDLYGEHVFPLQVTFLLSAPTAAPVSSTPRISSIPTTRGRGRRIPIPPACSRREASPPFH